VDVLDEIGSNIVVKNRKGEVIRILKRVNEEINEEWLYDKERFDYEGMKRKSIIKNLLKNENGEIVDVEWEDDLIDVSKDIKEEGNEIEDIEGGIVDDE
jgi:NADH dehydrogenase/NADH:ubiquinone oxidoreductase subunit G